MTDARFEDARPADRPLRLLARSAEDLEVVSALLQDAVLTAGDVTWMRGRRRAAFLLNRFRWEDREAAEREKRPYERVRSALLLEGVETLRAAGVDPKDPNQVLAVLGLGWTPAEDPEDPSGELRLTLSGDGEIVARAECLEVRLEDVTRPWEAPSGKAPSHPQD